MSDHGSRWPTRPIVVALALAAALSVPVAVAGCGVSSSGAPEDIGDGLVAETSLGSDIVRSAPDPDSAGTAEDLVRSYLKAAVGGGEASISHVKAFLTERARSAWRDPQDPKNPPITVIRLVGAPSKVPGTERTSVTVEYQVVGPLTDQGRVDELAELTTRSMTFWVRPAEQPSKLRIDEITGTVPVGLLLSDDALKDIYRIQPIYFWDSANSRLVPDLRYLPLTLTTEQRASKILQWLVDGPSSWLTGAQRLPTGTVPKAATVVFNRNGALVIKLSAQAGAGGPEAVRRLYYQLKWSLGLAAVPAIELQIEDKVAEIPGTAQEYLQYNEAYNLPLIGQKFDIVDRKVVTLGGVAPPPVLAAKENQDVVFAAINREASMAAYVRAGSDGSRRLQIVREGKSGKVDARFTPRSFDMGRPVWIPGSDDRLMVVSDGKLYVVRAADGGSVDVTPSQVSGSVSRVAVSPDGRRVAFVAAGAAYVASLKYDGSTMSVGLNPRRVLAGQLTAGAIAWASESWLYVTGTVGGKPAMWRTTADSVVAENLSEALQGVRPEDIVAHPAGPPSPSRLGELIVLTPQSGAFVFVTSLGTLEKGVVAPFFAG